MKIRSLFLFFILIILSSCGDQLNYKAKSFGGNSGSASSIVTISGSVLSTTSIVSSSSLLAGLEGKDFSRSISAFSSSPPFLGGMTEAISDDCANAEWEMYYIGEGDVPAANGNSAADGSFTIPTVPEGKEAIVVFSCASSEQKCLAKAGDSGLLCNAVADGVVGALEASFGQALTDDDYKGKSIAKVASAIVESTKTDSSDTESLKSAITTCKAVTNANDKKNCYKSAMEASSLSGTLDVVKTLAQTWTIRSLFNFITVTAGNTIYLDSMLYTPFGTAFDSWFDTDFVSQTKAYISDLVNNPDYINGNVANGEQVVRVECQAWFYKYGSYGQTKFKPTSSTNQYGVANVPDCLNVSELQAIKGGTIAAGALSALNTAIQNNNYQGFQLGLPGDDDGNGVINGGEAYVDWNGAGSDETNCSTNYQDLMNVKGSFCIYPPQLVINSKVKEPNRNDPTGINQSRSETNRGVSVIEIFEEVNTAASLMDEIAMSTASINYNPTYAGCFSEASGPGIGAGATCENWVRSYFQPYKKSFAGLMGMYMYLKDPSAYSVNGNNKLSLNDIHRLFTKSDFYNVKLTAWVPEYSPKSDTNNIHMPPLIDVTGANAKMQAAFHWSSPSGVNLDTEKANASLVDHYSLTFEMFENIPTSTQIQSYVMGASHHEEWNPYGEKYNYVPGVSLGGIDYPIFCKILNRTKQDAASNFLPMEKELSSATKIECLSNPVAAGVTKSNTTTGLFNVPSGFSYPYILVDRGWMGDNVGRLFSIADRKTGMELKIGSKEIFVVENKSGNLANIVVATPAGISCDGGAVTDANTLNSVAPIVKIDAQYGQGEWSRSEVVDAYCMDMAPYLISDTSAQFYYGGDIEISSNNNGNYYTYNQPLVGAVDSGGASYSVEPICLFTVSGGIEKDDQTGLAEVSGAAIGQVTTTNYSDPWLGTRPMITSWTSQYAVDYCDQSANYGGQTMYYIAHHYDDLSYAVGSRTSMPAALINSNDNTKAEGLYISLGAIESEYATASAIKVGNNSNITWFPRAQVLNTRHNAKFDPYCDDLNNNGSCDCYDAATSQLKSDPKECNLLDTAAEPTISRAPYGAQGSNSNDYETFFDTFGNLSGTQLVDGATSLSALYMDTNQLWMPFEDIMTCAYHLTGETTFRRPTNMIWDDFTSSHFEGCPASENAATITAITWTGPIPTAGGGPIRIMKPKPMNNAYDIERPKTMINMMNYFTKSVGQGVEIDRYAKVFTVDEALALVGLRALLPPQAMDIYDSTESFVYNGAFPQFFPVRASQNMDTSSTSAVLKALVKPSQLAAP